MVGNVWELVADWSDFHQGCTDWNSTAGISDGDASCFGGPGGSGGAGDIASLPHTSIRGGYSGDGAQAGVFALFSTNDASIQLDAVGFRCAR
jgi:formylglycine-generating enzyme required for sulfatase activity